MCYKKEMKAKSCCLIAFANWYFNDFLLSLNPILIEDFLGSNYKLMLLPFSISHVMIADISGASLGIKLLSLVLFLT
jgi:hypothetical protein